MSWKLLSVQKNRHLMAVDHKKPGLWGCVLPSRLCLGTFTPNWAVVGRAMLRILDWWMVSKSWCYSSMRPNCQLDLLDTGRKGKYPVAALSARVAFHGRRACPSKSEEMLRYKGSAVTLLSQILGCPHSSMIHSAIVQRLISFLNRTSKVFTICLWYAQAHLNFTVKFDEIIVGVGSRSPPKNTI